MFTASEAINLVETTEKALDRAHRDHDEEAAYKMVEAFELLLQGVKAHAKAIEQYHGKHTIAMASNTKKGNDALDDAMTTLTDYIRSKR